MTIFNRLSIVLTLCLLFGSLPATAQRYRNFEPYDDREAKAYIGIGAGLDYGGIGIKLEYMATPSFSGFAGVGYNLVGVGVNGGLTYRFMTEKKTRIFLTGMYGYNAALRVSNGWGGDAVFKKAYYGPSIGGGVEIDSRDTRKKVTLALLFPFRSSSFDKDYDELEQMGVEFRTKPLPISFTIGYNWALFRK